jgi:hypothetical protein
MHLGDPDNLGTAQVRMGTTTAPCEDAVEVYEGSAFLDGLALDGEYVVKIDVEGHEGEVVLGCLDFWRRRPPKGIVFESNTHLSGGDDFRRSTAFTSLTGAGFRIFQIPKTLFVLRYEEVWNEGPAPTASDFVAVRPDVVNRLWKPRPTDSKTLPSVPASRQPDLVA